MIAELTANQMDEDQCELALNEPIKDFREDATRLHQRLEALDNEFENKKIDLVNRNGGHQARDQIAFAIAQRDRVVRPLHLSTTLAGLFSASPSPALPSHFNLPTHPPTHARTGALGLSPGGGTLGPFVG